MKTCYSLCLEIDGKPVEFTMKADDSLQPKNKISDETADKWRNRLMAVAYTVFGKEI